ncbi:MAG: SecF protein [Candidatus Woesebacteria bacterium GW2011_GWB1_45_5]|uniref:Protein translocase subunit SecF n=1 Tax=Candidatus Woesebacteria bacterium GW2011_GWB1_45_5 TaxID=1618581 RepID=A0A0G1PUA1_9BACT|nr:MAG: SecF protein [Candidatus Woesebacteria bacterium GW2011_GWB1_45_5]
MKYRWLYLLISGTVLAMAKWGMAIGIDFTGGVVAEYTFSNGESKTLKYAPAKIDQAEKERAELKNQGATEIRFENVGPSIGPELVKKTVYALLVSSGAILLWIAYRFKSFKFGVSATLATLHDSLVLLGSFSLLGHFLGAEMDFLFVTAMLTVLSFSVHDTIVVYDRIREFRKKFPDDTYSLANNAISETMVRSLNNSFTIIFMLIALILMGGETVRWFAVALLVGTISGTYSSPFVAVPIFVTWDELGKRFKALKK